MSIFIGGVWLYVNGLLYFGYIVSLLFGDILVCYYWLKGENVLYVLGSDCNGILIVIRVK